MSVEHLIGQCWHNSKPAPPGQVKVWVEDGQGGGSIEYHTPEEAERITREQHQRESDLYEHF